MKRICAFLRNEILIQRLSRTIFVIAVAWYSLAFLKVFASPYIPIASDEIAYYNEIRAFVETGSLRPFFTFPDHGNGMSASHGVAPVLLNGVWGAIFGFNPHTQLIVNSLLVVATLALLRKQGGAYWYIAATGVLLSYYTAFNLFSSMHEMVHVFFSILISALLCRFAFSDSVRARLVLLSTTLAAIGIATAFRPTWALCALPLLLYSRSKREFVFLATLCMAMMAFAYYVWKTMFLLIPEYVQNRASSDTIALLSQGNIGEAVIRFFSHLPQLLLDFVTPRLSSWDPLILSDVFFLLFSLFLCIFSLMARNRFLLGISSVCLINFLLIIGVYQDTQHRMVGPLICMLVVSVSFARERMLQYSSLAFLLLFSPFVYRESDSLIAAHILSARAAALRKAETHKSVSEIKEVLQTDKGSGDITVLINYETFDKSFLSTNLPLTIDGRNVYYQIFDLARHSGNAQYALMSNEPKKSPLLERFTSATSTAEYVLYRSGK